MNTLGQIFRKKFFTNFAEQTMKKRGRPKVKPETQDKRKEKLRDKGTNLHAMEKTGEKPMHYWFDAKRARAVAKVYEIMRNQNRFTRKIKKEDHEHMVKAGNRYCEYMVSPLS